ncbi:MAG: ACT domain-containing protein [Oscillospiraceae bacterium]|jgi:ACT domain-containing protein|nr:ACT domain-containing protein [Oscillospiraceae bacterium]
MNGIITVLGKDRVGIIAKVCIYLSERGINILDISQTIVHGYFNMIMIADFSLSAVLFEDAIKDLEALGGDMGVEITLRHEGVFNAMHTV